MVNFNTWRSLVDGSGYGAIPDSAVLQFPFGERTDSTLVEKLEGADGTANNGLSNVSGTWYDGYAEDADGNDDYGDLGDWNVVNYGANLDDAGIIFTVQTTTTDTNPRRTPIGTYDTDGTRFWGRFNQDTDGDLQWRIVDDTVAVNRITFGSSLNDGNKKRIALRFPSDDATQYKAYVNGSEVSINTGDNSASASNFSNFVNAVFSHALNDSGAARHLPGTIDNIIPCLGGPTASEVSNDYDQQPWS